jgi:glucosamine--fructose-6-phosphate aminotransferase (isomerizing)
VITNEGDEETQRAGYKAIEIPQTVDCLQGVLSIIPLQLLSMHIAELRKCDVRI